MRIAVISDPHGDLVAMRAVIADLALRGLDHVLVAGDIAQGGPQPAEVVDDLRATGWPVVRGNSDDFLVNLAGGSDLGFDATPQQRERGEWSLERLGPERVAYLASLPMEFRRPWAPNGDLVVVHATPWSTEAVVLSDAPDEEAERMVREGSAGVLAYGHIHSPYQRRVGKSVLLSVGAIVGSNDVDGRPAYTILALGETVAAEVVRVDCAIGPRLKAYRSAGLEPTEADRDRLAKPGAWPVRAPAGESVQVWP